MFCCCSCKCKSPVYVAMVSVGNFVMLCDRLAILVAAVRAALLRKAPVLW